MGDMLKIVSICVDERGTEIETQEEGDSIEP